MPQRREVVLTTEPWELKTPFRITGYTFAAARLLYAEISQGNATGRGEAAGVYFLGETGDGMLAQAASVREALKGGASRDELRTLLPAGGARNAIDCALWDLEAKRAGKRVWELIGIEPRDTESLLTIGIGTPDEMAEIAKTLDTRKIKVKLDGELSRERMSAVCAARPDAEVVVDVNQGWTFEQLVELAPALEGLGVAMIEQPLPRGDDAALESYEPPVPLCADESCLDTGEFEQAARRYQMINVKLDKTGGLTEALDLVRMAEARGIGLMVGNMIGTSLAMAPGYVVGQLCRFVDLDGALFMKSDREHAMRYAGGIVSPPSAELWG